MQTEYTIGEDLQYELQRFVNNHDMALLNQNQRRLLVDFLDYELRTGVPVYLMASFIHSTACWMCWIPQVKNCTKMQ